MSSGENQSEGAYVRFLSERYFGAFDGLRCIAICAVIWHHALPGPVPGWLGRGHVGVPLFFALSGFLITTLLLSELRKSGHIAFGLFWMRRCLRIFPLYYAVLLGFVLWLSMLEPSEATRHFWRSLPFHASYTSNWFVDYAVPHPVWFAFAWSLATEEQFYAFWPPLLRHSARGGTEGMAGALASLVALDQAAECRWLEPWVTWDEGPQRLLSSLSSPMLLGALLAVLAADRRAFGALLRALGRPASVPLCLAGCAACIAWPPAWSLWLDAWLAALVGSCALARDTPFARALAWGPIAQLGRVSYAMYLFHVPVLGALRRVVPALVPHPAASFALGLLASWGLATLSARYLEAHFARLRSRFRPEPAIPSVLVAATGRRPA